MKKQTFFMRLLVPAVITLLLLPVLTCLIFNQAAKHYAYSEAVQNLNDFQENLQTVITESFYSGETFSINESSLNSFDSKITDNEKAFLYKVSPLASRMSGSTHLMILSSEMNIIYPRDEQTKNEVQPLASEFALYIQDSDNFTGSGTENFFTSDNEEYLINVYKMPDESAILKYVIAYCPVFQLGSWVKTASLIVLAISTVFALAAILSLWIAARSIIHPLRRLCLDAEQVGRGSFTTIDSEFSVKELEELRISMNQMSGQLMNSDEIQKNFFQNVSHELRNPLMSISGYAQGIEQGVFPQPQEAAHTILEESIRLTELVNGLLTLSRLESSRQDTAILVSVVLTDTVEDCKDRLNGLAIQKGVKLTLLPFDRSLTVWGSSELISQILDNLLTNAIRYASSEVIFSISESDSSIIISVSDDGTGISEKDMPHIFERCYKGNNGNFGIGLAIAHSAAEKMNGKLTASNKKSGGAEFTLTLKKAE